MRRKQSVVTASSLSSVIPSLSAGAGFKVGLGLGLGLGGSLPLLPQRTRERFACGLSALSIAIALGPVFRSPPPARRDSPRVKGGKMNHEQGYHDAENIPSSKTQDTHSYEHGLSPSLPLSLPPTLPPSHPPYLLPLQRRRRNLHTQNDVSDLALGERGDIDIVPLPVVGQDQILELHFHLLPLREWRRTPRKEGGREGGREGGTWIRDATIHLNIIPL